MAPLSTVSARLVNSYLQSLIPQLFLMNKSSNSDLSSFKRQLNLSRDQLRYAVRQRRKKLTKAEQSQASRSWFCNAVTGVPRSVHRGRRVGAYLAFDGEIDLKLWIQAAWRRNQPIYLPVLHPLIRHKVWFVRFQSDSQLKRNRLGIWEPNPYLNQRVAPWTLSTLFIPLVAFDVDGNRMGMGGGFYDRLLADFQGRPRRPSTVGCAHHLQKVDRLPSKAWDQPLDLIISDQQIIDCGL